MHDFFPDWKANRIQNQPVFILFELMLEPEAFLGKLSCILQRRKIESHKITAKSHNHTARPLKFVYSEKATKFCEIIPLLLVHSTYRQK